MTRNNIHVNGMTCGHCAETVTKAVQSLGGIAHIHVDLEKKQVEVEFDESQTDLKTISSKIDEVGFEVVSS